MLNTLAEFTIVTIQVMGQSVVITQPPSTLPPSKYLPNLQTTGMAETTDFCSVERGIEIIA